MMNEPQPADQPAAAAGKQTQSALSSLLTKCVAATPKTPPDAMEEMLRTLVDQARDGTVSWNKNVTATIERAIKEIDHRMSQQLAEIMHNEKFLRLEGTW